MSSFKFFCPYCGQHVEAEEEWIGLRAQCPCCDEEIEIIEIKKVPAPILKVQQNANNNSLATFTQKAKQNESKSQAAAKYPHEISLWQYFAQASATPFGVQSNGRACRKEYWSVILFSAVFWYLSVVVYSFLQQKWSASFVYVKFLNMALSQGCLFSPVVSKRVHDLGMDGKVWFCAPAAVIVFAVLSCILRCPAGIDIVTTTIYWLVVTAEIVIGCLKGDEESNRFGSNPLYCPVILQKTPQMNFRGAVQAVTSFSPFIMSVVILVSYILFVSPKYDFPQSSFNNQEKSYYQSSRSSNYLDTLPASQRDAIYGLNSDSTAKLNAIANILEDGKLDEAIEALGKSL